jgi:hypothetical protein
VFVQRGMALEAGATQGLPGGKVQKKQKENVGFFSFYGARTKQKGFFFLIF